MRIPSGTTDQVIYFVAVDATDLKTRETGLSSFTVYRARNGAAAASFTTPTVAEVSLANMPGVYTLLMDEDMTIDSGDDSQEMVFHITHAGMAPVTRTIELYRRSVTGGQTITTSSGTANADMVAISGDSTAADNAEKYFDGTGYGLILNRTTIATLASQSEFTLTAGSADDDAYSTRLVVIEDSATAAQKTVATISDYTGSTKTVTLASAQHAFTIVTGDIVTILAVNSPRLDASGYAQVDVQLWRGDGVPPPNTSGVPKVDTTLIEGVDATNQLAAAVANYDGPTNAEMEARTLVAASYATASALSTAQGNITSILAVTNKLDTALELDGAVYRLTTNALEQAPTGGSGGATAEQVWTYAVRVLTDGTIRVATPYQTGTQQLFRGTSYLNADGNAKTFAEGDEFVWPSDLASAPWVVKLYIQPSTALLAYDSVAASLEITGTVVDADNVRFDLTAAQTATLALTANRAPYDYVVRATKSSSAQVLESGTLQVVDDLATA